MILTTEHLGKRFNREWVIKDFTHQFHSGEIVAITGPNGSGKSTLMHMLWGQTLPSSGDIRWETNGTLIEPEALHQYLTIAAPYQDLIDEFTLEEQIDFHFSYKKPVDGLNREGLISSLYLEEAKKKKIENFSSGMRQRLKLGLALFSEAEMTFLDEPTTNLDQRGAEWYRKLLNYRKERLIFIATNVDTDYPEGSRVVSVQR